MKANIKPITWAELNSRLKDSTLHEAEKLLERVKSEGRPPQFILRATGRVNRLRGAQAIRDNLSGKR